MSIIKASQVYQSGASTTVECVSCGGTSTTASWRKGWLLPGGHGYANMCNRCGQSWVKLGRPGSLAGMREAERRKAASTSAPTGIKRPAADAPPPSPPLPGLMGGSQHVGAGPGVAKRARVPMLSLMPPLPRRRRISSGDESPSSSADTLTPDLDRRWRGIEGQPAQHPTPLQSNTSPQQPSTTTLHHQRAAPGTPGARPFVSYCIQKLSSGRAAHAAFWLQDEAGESMLAVVGTDARLSGHFTYATTPAFLELGLAPPLRCTNRTEVQAWLAGFGCTNHVTEGSVRLPELSAEQKRQVLTPEQPVWARPTTLDGNWQGVREESGRLTDGRHFKRFWLLGTGGQEKLIVTGVDSIRKDRRYKYFAEEDMGGFAFENSREVLAWINYALDRPENATPLEPEQVRAQHPLREDELGSFMARVRAAAQHERQPPPPPPPRAGPAATPASTPPSRALAAAGARAGAGAGASPLGGPGALGRGGSQAQLAGSPSSSSPYATSRAGKVRPMHPRRTVITDDGQDTQPPSPGLSKDDGPRLSVQRMQLSSPGHCISTQKPSLGASRGGPARPGLPTAAASPAARPPAVLLPHHAAAQPTRFPPLRCTTCGLTGHTCDDCLLAIVSPPSLIRTDGLSGGATGAATCAHHRTLSLLLSDRPSPRFAGSGTGSGGGSSGCDSPGPASPQLLSYEQLKASLVAEASSLEPAFSSRPVTPGLQQTFESLPQLYAFVSGVPSTPTRDTFTRWADKLTAHISNAPPPLPTCEEDTPLGGYRWTPTYEALAILHQLGTATVNLALLQQTPITGAVAQLRNHRQREIAAAAEAIVERWRGAAVSALTHASEALEAGRN